MNYVNGRVMNRWPDGGEVYLSAGADPSGSGTFHEGLNGWRAGSKFVFFVLVIHCHTSQDGNHPTSTALKFLFEFFSNGLMTLPTFFGGAVTDRG